MKISIGCDHGGYDLKEAVKAHLTEAGHEVIDVGCYDKSSCDYPDFGKPAAEAWHRRPRERPATKERLCVSYKAV